jgi:hypothetical protein
MSKARAQPPSLPEWLRIPGKDSWWRTQASNMKSGRQALKLVEEFGRLTQMRWCKCLQTIARREKKSDIVMLMTKAKQWNNKFAVTKKTKTKTKKTSNLQSNSIASARIQFGERVFSHVAMDNTPIEGLFRVHLVW